MIRCCCCASAGCNMSSCIPRTPTTRRPSAARNITASTTAVAGWAYICSTASLVSIPDTNGLAIEHVANQQNLQITIKLVSWMNGFVSDAEHGELHNQAKLDEPCGGFMDPSHRSSTKKHCNLHPILLALFARALEVLQSTLHRRLHRYGHSVRNSLACACCARKLKDTE
jgi:hypothetical protein